MFHRQAHNAVALRDPGISGATLVQGALVRPPVSLLTINELFLILIPLSPAQQGPTVNIPQSTFKPSQFLMLASLDL